MKGEKPINSNKEFPIKVDMKKVLIIKECLRRQRESFSHRDTIKPLLILKAKMKIFIQKKEKFENKD